MKKFMLFRCTKTNRVLISESKPEFQCKKLSEVLAANWLDAKRDFGLSFVRILA